MSDPVVRTFRPDPSEYVWTFGGVPPLARVAPGTVLELFTEDCFAGRVKGVGDLVSEVCEFPYVNPQTGPFYVEGAEPGDTLAVHFVSLEPARDWAVSTTVPLFGALTSTHLTATLQDPLPEVVWIWQLDRARRACRFEARFGEFEVDLPMVPMHGTVEVAQANLEVRSSLVPDAHGGNLDSPEMHEGVTCYLGVNVEGAMFSIGDGHARQGEGETCGVAAECAMDTVLVVDLIKGRPCPWPRLESDTHLISTGSTRPLEDAFRIAQTDLVRWLEADYGLHALDAYQLVSQAVESPLANVVDTNYTSVAKIAKQYLPRQSAMGDTHARLVEPRGLIEAERAIYRGVMLPSPHPDVLLELDLTSAPLEIEPDDLVGRVRSRHRPRLRAVLRALHEAGDDRHVRGVLVKVGGAALPWAVMQELRAGLTAFRASGKPVVAWAETLGEGGNGTPGYVLASACSQVWLQPSGELGLLGVAAETTFLRGALDKLGVEPQLDQRYEYKSAADRVMRHEFSPAHHEALDRIVESTWETAVSAIATGRGLEPAAVRERADRAPLSADEAREAGLVDRLGYRDEVYAAARADLGDGVQLLFADQWRPRRRAAALIRRRRAGLALVDGHGEIVVGRGRNTPRGPQLGSTTVSAALRAAREADHVRAVLFRIDSPGGSAVASDTIWREVQLTRDAGKPVVVSMSSLAGSGGYYIACPADVIVAQPTTITGSIGVLGGKAVAAELMTRLGLTTGAVERGGQARMFSVRRGFTEAERDRLGALLDRIYDDFVAKVAAGRQMSVAAVDAVARGRIWTGADAAGNGLVDVLGGLRDAAAIARERAGLAADAPIRPAVHVPPIARLRRPQSSEDPRAAAARSLAGGWGELASLAAGLGWPSAGPLRMPDVRLG